MFFSGLLYYLIRFVFFSAFVCGGVFLGMKLRNNKNANISSKGE